MEKIKWRRDRRIFHHLVFRVVAEVVLDMVRVWVVQQFQDKVILAVLFLVIQEEVLAEVVQVGLAEVYLAHPMVQMADLDLLHQ